jgi:hypothetical protein
MDFDGFRWIVYKMIDFPCLDFYGFLHKLMANPKSLAMISCDEMGIKDVTGRLRVVFSYKIHGKFMKLMGFYGKTSCTYNNS